MASQFSFFDPNEPKCRAILLDPRTSVPELFAVLRQWVPQVQQNISLIGNEILKRGCGVNDRDSLTDMTLLHYTCKAGAPGIGESGPAVGTLRFCGGTEFASGQWAGVELDDPEGKNDGSVGGVQYFSCQPKHGIFAPLSKIGKASERRRATLRSSTPLRSGRLDLSHGHCRPALGPTLPWVTVALHWVPHTPGSLSPCTVSHTPLGHCRPARPRGSAVEPPFQASVSNLPSLRLSALSPRSRAQDSVREQRGVGGAGGAAGGASAGGGAEDRRGALLWQDQLRPGIHGSLDSLSELSAARLNHTFPGMRRSLSTSSALTAQREASRRSPVSRTRPPGLRRSWSTASTGKAAGGAGAGTPGSDGAVKLHLGMTVLLTSANEMGTVRYLGPADFAPGLWLGLELRAPKGKNDGSVGDRRYFSCRPGHGVLVRPSRVTYRGINGAKLVDEGS
nr:PREDICTED: CAP-Gly domain-containing linker protein 4-like [Lepisosteus oculatus]